MCPGPTSTLDRSTSLESELLLTPRGTKRPQEDYSEEVHNRNAMGDKGAHFHGHASGDAMQIDAQGEGALSRKLSDSLDRGLSRKSTDTMLKGEGAAGGDARGPPRKRSRKHSPEELKEIRYATAMQRFRTHKLAADGEKFGMTSAVAKAIPFADLSTRLRDTALIKVMKLTLHRVCVLTAEGVRSCPGAEVLAPPPPPSCNSPLKSNTHPVCAQN
ncbi:hypothetical protein T484DRAFT_1763512 [Baffinella frigidus]|nr:hypothetical protein T484DRAFT_1763512 [Cryptophyta sp. CCMP2293]